MFLTRKKTNFDEETQRGHVTDATRIAQTSRTARDLVLPAISMLQKMEMPTDRSMDSAPPEPFSHRRDTKTSPSQPPRLELPNRVLTILTLPSSPMSPSQHLPVPYTINSCVERSRCTKGNGGHGSGFASLLFVSLESRRLSIGPARVVLNLL